MLQNPGAHAEVFMVGKLLAPEIRSLIEARDFNGLRELFREGTRPSSEEIARRLGYEPLDTGPLVADLSAA